MLDSRRLEIFCAVAEAGSITAASGRLHLTQSAVSQQVAILERDLGLPLFERVARGVRLTPAGDLLARRGRALLHDLTGLQKELRGLADPSRTVRLGVFSTAGAHLVPMLVQAYRQRYPDTQLVLCPSQREELLPKLTAGEIDVGITWDYDFMPRPVAELKRRLLFADPMQLLLARDHRLAGGAGPLRLADVADEPWVVRTHHAALYADAFEIMCGIAGFAPRIVFRTEDYPSAQGFVAAGVGVAVAPQLALQARRPDIVVRDIGEPAFARRIEAVTLAGGPDDPLVEQLIDVLVELGAGKPAD
jgi:DNA-binding transcriptional LysR family regulator